MKEEILENLDNPSYLEKLFRTDKSAFKQAFTVLYPQIKDNTLAGFWKTRLDFEKEETLWGTGKDMAFVLMAALVAGIIAKLPVVLNIDEEFFYSRNIGFIVFPALTAYFARKNKLSLGKIIFIVIAFMTGLVFINSLPDMKKSDTLFLSAAHLILFLWFILGFSFVTDKNDVEKRLGYLKFNGDLVVMTTLIVISGGIVTVVTISLFSLIGLNIEKFFFENIVVFGLPAAPILGTYLVENMPQLVGKVSPVIARIFSPIVLIMLVIYLIAIIYSGKDPYNDRAFLLMFNILLVGVMAIIFFSVAGTSPSDRKKIEIWVLYLLSVVTVIVNAVALSAILFRISEWGITPNRTAVLGANMLILINLLMVTVQLLKAILKKTGLEGVGKAIAQYLPVYWIWAIIVVFIFPFLFGFK